MTETNTEFVEKARQTVKMGKAVYEAIRAVEQNPSGHEQLLFEACCWLEQACDRIEQQQELLGRIIKAQKIYEMNPCWVERTNLKLLIHDIAKDVYPVMKWPKPRS